MAQKQKQPAVATRIILPHSSDCLWESIVTSQHIVILKQCLRGVLSN